MKEINREYKDRVFKFIFGNPTNKEWTLSLYNAVNGSAHRNPDDIRFNTLEDAVYMNMKNDVSYHEVQDLEVAVDAAIREMPDSFAIRPFLIGHHAEVRNMFIGTFDEEREREKGRLEAHREGLKEGRKEGRLEAEKELNERVATDMLKEGEPIPKIVKYSKLSEAAILKLAKSLGVAVL